MSRMEVPVWFAVALAVVVYALAFALSLDQRTLLAVHCVRRLFHSTIVLEPMANKVSFFQLKLQIKLICRFRL